MIGTKGSRTNDGKDLLRTQHYTILQGKVRCLVLFGTLGNLVIYTVNSVNDTSARCFGDTCFDLTLSNGFLP